jgi:predicted regulator of Ras-like GTPase activity (Roadblock/LC7/MglB family)
VLLVAAGSRAVLTVMAGAQAKLGLVLYDMKTAAAQVADILG